VVEPVSPPLTSGTGYALPETEGKIVNFYTMAYVMQAGRGTRRANKLQRVLIDGGSVLNMMPLAVAQQMKLELKPQKEIIMRTAALTFHKIKYYVNLEVIVAGVTSFIHCYCLPGVQSSYTLLLGRRWMKQVRALGNYAKDTYHIHDMAGNRYAVDAEAAPSTIQAEIPQLCTNTNELSTLTDLDSESVDELSVSRNNLCNLLYKRIREQVGAAQSEEEDSEEMSTVDEESESGEYDERKTRKTSPATRCRASW